MRRRVSRHRVLSDANLAWMQEQALKRVEIERRYSELPNYDQVAERTGLTRGSARVMMAQLMREIRSGETRMRRGHDNRGTAVHELEASEIRGQW